MATISIITPQNIELEYDLGSLGERVLARLIDLLIIAGYVGLTIAILSYTSLWGSMGGGNLQLVLLFLFLPVLFYDLLCEILLNGQSVGKKAMSIKVISLNGDQASTGQYLIRWLFRLVDFSIGGGLIAVIMVAATEKHQRLGDLVAGTALVRTKSRAVFAQTLYTPVPQSNYIAAYPEVTHLSDNDIQLVKEVLLNVQKSGNTMLAVQAMQKIEHILNIRSQHEPVTFLYAILSDYNHLASKL